jgi:hypothetical protein
MLSSDAVIWGSLLLIVVGAAAAVAMAVVWLLTLPAAGSRVSGKDARRTYARILSVAVVAYVALFISGMIAGAFQ